MFFRLTVRHERAFEDAVEPQVRARLREYLRSEHGELAGGLSDDALARRLEVGRLLARVTGVRNELSRGLLLVLLLRTGPGLALDAGFRGRLARAVPREEALLEALADHPTLDVFPQLSPDVPESAWDEASLVLRTLEPTC